MSFVSGGQATGAQVASAASGQCCTDFIHSVTNYTPRFHLSQSTTCSYFRIENCKFAVGLCLKCLDVLLTLMSSWSNVSCLLS